MSRGISETDGYLEKLAKLIPGEIIAAFVAIQGIVDDNIDYRRTVLFVSVGVLTTLIPFYLFRFFRVRNYLHIVVAVVSFWVWVVNVGAGYSLFPTHFNPDFGAVTLILWTTIVPIFGYTEVNRSDSP